MFVGHRLDIMELGHYFEGCEYQGMNWNYLRELTASMYPLPNKSLLSNPFCADSLCCLFTFLPSHLHAAFARCFS
jgi:hypothetical protein